MRVFITRKVVPTVIGSGNFAPFCVYPFGNCHLVVLEEELEVLGVSESRGSDRPFTVVPSLHGPQ